MLTLVMHPLLFIAAAVAVAIAIAITAPAQLARAAGGEWYDVNSPHPLVDFDPPPIADWEPGVRNLLNDRIGGYASFVHYGFFTEPGANASVVLTSFATHRLEYHSPRDNLEFFLGGWNVAFSDVGEFRSLDTPLGRFNYATFTSRNGGIDKSGIAFTCLITQRKEVTGFYCRADGNAMADSDIRPVISSIVLLDA